MGRDRARRRRAAVLRFQLILDRSARQSDYGRARALDPWPVTEGEPEGELILLGVESSPALFRGIAYGVLICLCFWIPLAVAVAIILV